MIIDFHTHVFPDKIAEKTIDFLAQKSGNTPSFNGSVDGLIQVLKSSPVQVAVSLPVLTKPEQFESVLSFAKQINERFENEDKKIISFAGMHPYLDDIKGKMKRVKEAGIKGVKIHPDYQNTFIDHEGYLSILNCAKDLDLIVVTHAGVDCGYRDCSVKCPPELLGKVIDKVNYDKFVLAHMGGSEMVSDVLKFVAGKNVYFDTSYVLKYLTKQEFNSLLKKHGEDKILFATDSPWSEINSDVQILNKFVENNITREKIYYKNAKALLGI